MLTKPEIYALRKKAFSEAAEHLEATAKDFDVRAAKFPGREHAAERGKLKDKAELLRIQAVQLRRMF